MVKKFSSSLLGLLILFAITLWGFSPKDDSPRVQKDPRVMEEMIKYRNAGFRPFVNTNSSDYVPNPNFTASTLSESFEGATFPPTGWSKLNPDAGSGWEQQADGTTPMPGWVGGTITVPPGGATKVAYCTWTTGGASSNNQYLVTPQITNVQSGDSLKFWMRYWPDSYSDSIDVRISTTTPTASAFTIVALTKTFAVGSGDTNWSQYKLSLGSLVAPGSNIYIAWREHVSDNINDGSSFSLDLVDVSGTTYANDVSSNSMVTPSGPVPLSGSPFVPQAQFGNPGTNNQGTPFNVTFKVTGAVTYTSTKTTTITSGGTSTVNFDNFTPNTAGLCNVTIYTSLGSDQNRSNDTLKTTFTIVGSAMSGSYTVGLTAFNRATGRNLTLDRVVNKVMKQVPVALNRASNEKVASEETSTGIYPESTMEFREVEEVSFVPMENGKPYTGSLFASREEYPNIDAAGIYPTITAACNDLNLRGSSSNVTFLLIDGTYPSETYPIVVNNPSASASRTLTIKPNTGVVSSITGSVSGTMFKVLSSYTTIDGSNNGSSSKDMSITNNSATSPTCLNFGSTGTTPITNCTLKNVNITNNVNATAVVLSDGTTLGNPGYFNNMLVTNNSISRSYIGVYSITALLAGNGANTVISLNQLTSSGANAIQYIGIYMQGLDGASVTQNEIANFDGTASIDDRGVWFATGTTNCTITRNNIHDLRYTGTGGYGGYGLYISTTTTTNSAYNNFIHGLAGDGWQITSIPTDNPIGIVVTGTGTSAKLYYNSINLYGNTLNQTGATSMGIFLATGASADIKDNIITNNLGLLAALGNGAVGIYAQTANTQFAPLNYNLYYINPTGSAVKNFGRIATTGQTTFAGWQTAALGEANGQNGNPLFVSNTDLHISSASSPAVNNGTPIVGITTDIDGNTRSATTPTIGADEYATTQNLTMSFRLEAIQLTRKDTVTVSLRSTVAPYPIVQTKSGVYDSLTGTITLPFTSAVNGTSYYLFVSHRNSISTWSAVPVLCAANVMVYDFSTAIAQAYSSNMKLVSGKASFFTGDVDRNGLVDLTDVLQVYNASSIFTSGSYVLTDLNYDGIVDLTDVIYASNNSNAFVQQKNPPGFVPAGINPVSDMTGGSKSQP